MKHPANSRLLLRFEGGGVGRETSWKTRSTVSFSFPTLKKSRGHRRLTPVPPGQTFPLDNSQLFFSQIAIAVLAFFLMPLCLYAEEVAPEPSSAPPVVRVESLSPEQVNEALTVLQQRHVSAKSLDANALAQATLRGLFDKLQPGAELISGESPAPDIAPFRAEALKGDVGYIRLGSLLPETITELDGTLKDFAAHHVDAVVLDLRATPASQNYELAASVASRFVPKGISLFSLSDAKGKAVKSFNSESPQTFHGVIVIIADASAAGAAEAIAAALRKHANAMIVGATTSGRAVEFFTIPLGKEQSLRFASTEVRVEGLPAIYPQGLHPDLEVAQESAVRGEVLADSLESGAAPFIFERERVRMNEAALVEGTNPEIDAPEEKPTLVDRPLQRAVDLVTAIRFFHKKDPPTAP